MVQEVNAMYCYVSVPAAEAPMSLGVSGCRGTAPYCCNGTPETENYPFSVICIPDTSRTEYGGSCPDDDYPTPGCCTTSPSEDLAPLLAPGPAPAPAPGPDAESV